MDYKEAIKQAQAEPLDEKIRKAILLLQTYEPMALELSERGYYLAFSGGKDSIVIKELARLAGVKYAAFYNQTTIDPPELVRFIQTQHPEVEWNRAEINMLAYLARAPKGPPTRLNRWCCEKYKEGGGHGLFKIIGVRAQESPRRAERWRNVTPNRTGGMILCPVLYWTDDDIWAFIKANNLPYCPLYDETDPKTGKKLFTRLGCIGCPMGGKNGRMRDFARWPKFKNLWHKAFQDHFDHWRDIPRRNGEPRSITKFANWKEFWNWWVEYEDEEPEECQGMIDWLS